MAVAFAVVTVACVLFVDKPLARAIAPYEPSTIWDSGILGLEWAILLPLHKLAVPVLLVVGMVVAVIVKRWRPVAPVWMMIAGVHLLSRLTTNWIKDGTGRLRPYEWFKPDTSWVNADGTFGWDKGIAFPSGHVVLFASLLVPLVMAVPREKSWLPLLGVLAIVVVAFVSAARIAIGAHWISDTTGAITLVVAWSWLVGWVARPDR